MFIISESRSLFFCSECASVVHKEPMREESSNTELFWSVFSRILSEYGELRSKSLYSVKVLENTDQKIPYLDNFYVVNLSRMFDIQRSALWSLIKILEIGRVNKTYLVKEYQERYCSIILRINLTCFIFLITRASSFILSFIPAPSSRSGFFWKFIIIRQDAAL